MSDDLIKRSDAIKAVSKVDDYGDGIGFEVRSHCLVELELVPSADRPQGEWIPCSERLPKKRNSVYKDITFNMTIYDIRKMLMKSWTRSYIKELSPDGK